jgi:hypothetical protein
MRNLFGVLFFLSFSLLKTSAQQLILHATIESIGAAVTLPANYDVDKSAKAMMRYRKAGESWREGFPLSRLAWNGGQEFRGSVFQASPGTSYEVEVTLRDSSPVFSQVILSGQILTRPEPEILATANVKYVSPTGSGIAYTFNNPGNLQTLLAAPISCGTTIMFRGGDYAMGDQQISLTEDCTPGAPIIFMAAPGEKPVLNGGDSTQYVWTPHPSDPDLYYTTVSAGLENGAMCLMDGQRLYPYASLTTVFAGYPYLVNLQYGLAGYYRIGLSYFIKTPDGINPNGRTVVLSRYSNFLRVYGNNKRNFLVFKGLTFKYYGKGTCNYFFGDINLPQECFPSATLDLRDVNDVTIDACNFWFNNNPITFTGKTDRNVVQNCVLHDQTGRWPHAAFKQSRDAWAPFFGLPGDFGSFGRYLENGGILFQTGTANIEGNVLRKNRIDGYVIGIGIGAGSASPSEHDISDNDIGHSYDAIESTSGFVNHRVWGNRLHHGPVGMSMALPAYGPFYVFRNVFDHLGSRYNYLNPNAADGGDPHWLDCDNNEWPVSWSTALKLNVGGSIPNPGDIFFIHNTVHGIDSLGFNLYLWENTWRKLFSRNNIYYSEAQSNVFFDGVQGLDTYDFDSERDNFYSPNAHPIAGIRPVHGVPSCTSAETLADFESTLRDFTDSPTVRISDGRVENPLFQDIADGNFYLTSDSPMMDAAVSVPGFNDQFFGAAADIGAFEHTTVADLEPSQAQAWRMTIAPNPSSGSFELRADIPLLRLDVYDALGRWISSQNIDNEKFARISISVPGLFWVRVQTQDGRVGGRKVLVN